jgi:hypothetical protein
MVREPEPGTEAGWEVIDAAVASARGRLGDGLISAYAIGSLAHGGFAPAVSDVDLALLTDERPDRAMGDVLATVAGDVRDKGLTLGDRLSVFHAPWVSFADPPPSARFRPIDRYDLIRYGLAVHGDDLRSEHGSLPSASELRAQAVDSALRRVTPEQLEVDLRELASGGVSVHDATKAVLWPVRLLHVCDTGQATRNADAVDHYLAISNPRHRPLVHDALTWRSLSRIPEPRAALQRITSEIRWRDPGGSVRPL